MPFFDNLIKTYLSRISLSLITFALNVIIARIAGAENLGLYASSLASALLLANFCLAGSDAAFLYFSSRKTTSVKQLYKLALVITSISGSFAAVLLQLFKWTDFHLLSQGFALLPVIVITIFQLLLVAICSGKGRLHFVNKLLIFIYLVFLLSLLSIHYYRSINHTLLLQLYSLFHGILCIILSISLLNLRNTESTAVPLVDIITYGLKLYPGLISGVARLRTPIIIAGVFIGVEQVGYLAVAYTLTEALFIFAVVLATVLTPKLVNLAINERYAYVNRCIKIGIVLSVIMLIIINLLIHHLIPILYGVLYTSSITLFSILSITVASFTLSKILATYFNTAQQPQINSKLEAIALLILFSSLFLMKDYGAIGIVCASLISSVLLTVMLFICYLKQTKQSIKEILTVNIEDKALIRTYWVGIKAKVFNDAN